MPESEQAFRDVARIKTTPLPWEDVETRYYLAGAQAQFESLRPLLDECLCLLLETHDRGTYDRARTWAAMGALRAVGADDG